MLCSSTPVHVLCTRMMKETTGLPPALSTRRRLCLMSSATMKVPAGKTHSSESLTGASILTSKVFNQNHYQQNPDSDLACPPRRRTRLKRVGRRSRPDTPLLKWKIDEGGGADEDGDDAGEDDKLRRNSKDEARRGSRHKSSVSSVSARKLVAGLWRLQSPEPAVGSGGCRGVERRIRSDGLGFQPGSAHVGVSFVPRDSQKVYGSQFEEPLHIPATKNNKFLCKELETERQSSKKKLEHFLKKVSEERSVWMSREHEKIRAFISDIKADLSRERKSRQRLEILNLKLVNELADTKVSAKRLMQDYGKERKARELIEEVCDELAREIGDDKAEIEAINREGMKMREEVDDERKMLQMAEVWREERVQMKLVDAKVALEEKYSQMNKVVGDLLDFLKSKGAISDIKQAESLMQAAASINIEEVKEFTYELPNSNDIFAVLEEVNSGEPNEKDIEQCDTFSRASHGSNMHTASPEANLHRKDCYHRNSIPYMTRNEEIEEDESGWETVSHIDDQGSSFSAEGSVPSVNKHHGYSNVSGSGTEWEDIICKETPIEEISEVCSMRSRQGKKVSGIARLWKTGDSYKTISDDGTWFSSERKSSACIVSPDRGSDKDRRSSPCGYVGQWSSPESGISQLSRGIKGCMEWPKGTEKHSSKSKLMEARMQSQKLQLRHVLKQKI
ncbi:Uncharacterized protein At5g41620 [Linum perenne]